MFSAEPSRVDSMIYVDAVTAAGVHVDPYNADVNLAPTSESARYKIAMMEQIMRRMGETASKNNVALMFLLIPSPIDVADVHETGEVDPVKYPEYKR